MEFNSQICTTKEQSERLIALGIKTESADMMYCNTSYGTFVTEKDDDYLEHLDFPTWSLHRLIEMMPSFTGVDENPFGLEFKIAQGKLILYESIVEDSIGFVWGHGNLYDSIISCIAQLIKEGHFNKEYLEEK